MTLHRPDSEAALAALIAGHHQNAAPLVIEGGGSSGLTAGLPGEILSTAGLNGVVDYQPGELTLIARAGTPLSGVTALLEQSGQCLAFEPPDLSAVLGRSNVVPAGLPGSETGPDAKTGETAALGPVPTIGGVVASNASGPRRLLSGACRDHVLGVRMVDGRGRILRNGGRVMKNVTGLDLSRLLAGSHGTLAVLSEVALRTLPRAEASLTLTLAGQTPERAQALLTRVLATPWEISGAACLGGRVHLRLEGLAPQVALRREKLLRLLACDVGESGDEASRSLWRGLRDLEMFCDHSLPLWRVQVRAGGGLALAAALENLGGTALADWGGGLIWYQGKADPAAIRHLAPQARLIRRAGLSVPRFPGEAPGLARLSQGLRQVFDPARIFNRGLMDPADMAVKPGAFAGNAIYAD